MTLHLLLTVATVAVNANTPLLGSIAVNNTAPSLAFRSDTMVAFVGVAWLDDAGASAALQAINVSNPNDPVLLAPLSTNAPDTRVLGLAVEGSRSYLFCESSTGATSMHDLAADPRFVSAMQADPLLVADDDVRTVFPYQGDVYVLYSNRSLIFNVLIPGLPGLLKTLDLNCSNATGITVVSSVAYVACWSAGGVVFFDVSKPAQAQYLGFVATDGNPVAIAGVESLARLYVVTFDASNTGVQRLQLFDVSTRTTPTLASHSFNFSSSPVIDLSVSEPYVMLATTDQVLHVNCSPVNETSSFTLVGQVDHPSEPTAIVASPFYTFVVDKAHNLSIYNTSAIAFATPEPTPAPAPEPTPKPEPAPTDAPHVSSSSSSKVGIVVGVIGGFVGVALIAGFAHKFYARRHHIPIN